MKMKMKHKVQKALAVILILACTFSVNLNVFADDTPDGASQTTTLDASKSQAVDPNNQTIDESSTIQTGNENETVSNDVPADQQESALVPQSESVTITLKLNGGNYDGNTNDDVFTITTNTIPEPSDAPTYDGYAFDGWYDAQEGGSKWDFSTVVTAPVTLWAHWTEKPSEPVTVTLKLNGGNYDGNTNDDVFTITTNTIPEPSDAPTYNGYAFDGWYDAQNGGSKWNFSTVVAVPAVTLWAHWIPQSTPATIPVTAIAALFDESSMADISDQIQSGEFTFKLTRVTGLKPIGSPDPAAWSMEQTCVAGGKATFEVPTEDFKSYTMNLYELTEEEGTDKDNIAYNTLQMKYYVVIGADNTSKDNYTVTYFTDENLTDQIDPSQVTFINKKISSQSVTATKIYQNENGQNLTITDGQFKVGYTIVKWDDFPNSTNPDGSINWDYEKYSYSQSWLEKLQKNTTADNSVTFDKNGKCSIPLSGLSDGQAMLVYEYDQNDPEINYSKLAFWIHKWVGQYMIFNFWGTGTANGDVKYSDNFGFPIYNLDLNPVEFNEMIQFTNTRITKKEILVKAANTFKDQNGNILSQSDGQFSFNLHYLYGDMKTVPADQTATNDSNGNVVFDLTGLDFSVGQAGTAQMAVFQLTETPGTDSSIKYNSDGKTYYVVVGYDNAQTWYTVTYFQDMTAGGPINQINEGKDLFTNIRTVTSSSTGTSGGSSEYVPTSKYPAVIDLPVQKLLGGDTPDTTATFTFALKADNPKFPMPSGSSNGVKMMNITGAGSGEFGNIAYYQPGTYTYTCYEVNNNTAGYTYDTSTFTMKVVVVDAGDRLLATRAIVRSDGNAADGFAFGNWYTKTAVTPVAVTNTPAPTNPDVPKTADSFPLYLFILMLAAGSAGIITVAVAIYKNSRRSD
jgi:pilin isopeptide linkage protein/uncharacterized repeat protein (TIGR02543 family)